jgi:outer membrane protein TolC
MKIKLCILWFFLLMISTDIFSQKVSMEQAISIALERNQKIKQYNEKIEQAKFKEKEAWGNFLPSIDLQASYTHLKDPIVMDLDPIRQAMIQIQTGNQVELANIYNYLKTQTQLTAAQRAALSSAYASGLSSAIPKFEDVLKKQDYRTATLIGIQPLFLGGKLLAAKDASIDERIAAEIELKKTKDEIIQETVNNYLSVVLVTDVIKTRQNVLDGMKLHKNQAEKLLKEGLIANYHVLRAEVAVAEAERNLYDDKNKLTVAYLALQNSMGMDNETVIVDDSLIYKPLGDTLSTYIEKALNNYPLLKLIAIKRDEASQKYKADRSEFLPQIAAFGKYEMIPKDLSIMEPHWAVGIQLNYNLFKGFKDYNNIQTTTHMQDELKFLESDARSKIGLLVNKTYKDVLNAKERYERLDASISLAEENLRLNEKRFETGLGTSLEVIDARLSLAKIQVDRKVSIYDYYKSINELLQTAGEPENVLSIWNKKEK